MTLEVIERHVFHLADPVLASDMRRALNAGDLERLDDLITFLRDGEVNTTCDVLEVAEVKR
jgi:hypothetical protein